MEYLVTAQQMQRYDRATSEHFGVPSIVLMERAALACAGIIEKRQENIARQTGIDKKPRVLVAAGCGNNGADGFAVGRLLLQAGYPVDFWLAGEAEKAGELTRRQMQIAAAYGGVISPALLSGAYDIIIDGLFGIGLSREVTGIYRQVIDFMNQSDAFVLSVDIPSGICADTGKVLGAAVCADVTVTFGFQKLGTFLYPGARYAGQVICRSIGITQDSFLDELPINFTFTEPVSALLPKRDSAGNKGSFGKVALFAGSPGMAGAALLSGRAVFATGAGMVKIVTPEGNRIILQEALPEAMTECFAEKGSGMDCLTAAKRALQWADVIAIGPGLSQSKDAAAMLGYVVANSKKPLVIDADAINLLSADTALFAQLEMLQQKEDTRRALVLTPHPGELARLAGVSIEEVLADPAGLAGSFAGRLQAAVLCKGARTVVVSPQGQRYWNGSGNSGMAVAGSGDVLTGMIAALLAQSGSNADAFLTACTGVYLHGLAGDKAAHALSEYSMKAGDIVTMTAQLLADGE